MARPTKQGIDYFPLDIHLDDKFKFIEVKFGLEGFAIIIKIFQKIYANGYWCDFNNDEQLLFSYDINVDINRVNAVINEALCRDIFDKRLFDTYGILTSKGIQKRYKEVVKRRKDVEIVEEYLLIKGSFGVNDNIISVNVDINQVNACKSTQSKVKESKVKESKVDIILPKGNMSVGTDPKELHSVDFSNILDYWNKHSKLKSISAVTDKRKGHLNSRFKEHGLQAIYRVIDNVSKSSFMRGNNNRGWMATFDWVFLPNNFVKVLEGNYLDKPTTTKIMDDVQRRVDALRGSAYDG